MIREDSSQDEPWTLVPPHHWVILVILIGLLIAGFSWAVFGQVRTIVAAPGVVGGEGGAARVVLSQKGVVEKVHVSPGDVVDTGQLLVELALREIEAQLKLVRERMQEKEAAAEEAWKELQKQQKELLVLEESGYPPAELEGNRQTIAKTRRDFSEAERQFEAAEERYKELLRSLTRQDEVKASRDGVVLDVNLQEGNVFDKGDVLMTLGPPPGDEQKVVAFVSQGLGRPEVGQPALVLPRDMDPSQHGYARARVDFVSGSPRPRSGVARFPLGERTINELMERGEPYLVRLSLVGDKEAPSGIEWTLGEGPPTPIGPGTRCQVRIITDTLSPLELAFPALR